MRWLIAVVVVTACDRQPAVTSCRADLHGVWIAPSGERWALLDHGGTLEAFALFDDAILATAAAPAGAPRVIDLARDDASAPDGTLAGEVKRRFTRGGDHCDARAALHVTACDAAGLQVVIADPQPPLAFAPCAWGAPPTSRVERWRRE